MEVLDMYFCVLTDSSDAAESVTIDYYWVKDGDIAFEMIKHKADFS